MWESWDPAQRIYEIKMIFMIIWCKYWVHMYVNGKMISVETIPGMGGGGWKRVVEGVNSNTIYLIHCKNFCKCHNITQASTIKNKLKNWKKDIINPLHCVCIFANGKKQWWVKPLVLYQKLGLYQKSLLASSYIIHCHVHKNKINSWFHFGISPKKWSKLLILFNAAPLVCLF
jgi:hypothetical protein